MSLILIWLNAALGAVSFVAWGKRAIQKARSWQYRFFACGISGVGLYFWLYYSGILFHVYPPEFSTWTMVAVTALLSFVTALAFLKD